MLRCNTMGAMNLAQLIGMYNRMRQEIAVVRQEEPRHSARVARLVRELDAMERELAHHPSTDEQCDELAALPFMTLNQRERARA